MIWGGVNHQRQADLETWRRRFAYVPVRLWGCRWLWWGWYYVRVSRVHPEMESLRSASPVVQRFVVVPSGRSGRDRGGPL